MCIVSTSHCRSCLHVCSPGTMTILSQSDCSDMRAHWAGVCLHMLSVCCLVAGVQSPLENSQSSSCASSDELVVMTEVSFSLLLVALLFTLCCVLVLR